MKIFISRKSTNIFLYFRKVQSHNYIVVMVVDTTRILLPLCINYYHNKRQHLFSTNFYYLIFCDYAIYVWLLYFITCASREKLAKLSIVLSDHRYLSAMIYSTIKTSGQILSFLIHPYKNTDRFKSIYRYSCQNSV